MVPGKDKQEDQNLKIQKIYIKRQGMKKSLNTNQKLTRGPGACHYGTNADKWGPTLPLMDGKEEATQERRKQLDENKERKKIANLSLFILQYQ